MCKGYSSLSVFVYGLVHNVTLHHALHCIAFTSTLVAMQRDTRIDLDSILTFLCIGFLCLITKKITKKVFTFHKLTQRKALRPIVNLPYLSILCYMLHLHVHVEFGVLMA